MSLAMLSTLIRPKLSILSPTWTPEVCEIMAVMALIMGLGLFFYILLGSRHTLNPKPLRKVDISFHRLWDHRTWRCHVSVVQISEQVIVGCRILGVGFTGYGFRVSRSYILFRCVTHQERWMSRDLQCLLKLPPYSCFLVVRTE